MNENTQHPASGLLEKGTGVASLEIFLAFLRLGCTSFGGPVAHLGFFRAEFVERRKWISNDGFAELLSIAQSIPGPASSQLGFALGLLRGGVWGGFAAWLGFTLPSAALMLSFGLGSWASTSTMAVAVLHGFQLAAVAVVAQAVLAMQRTLAPDRQRIALAVAATGIVLYAPSSIGSILAIGVGALLGVFGLRPETETLPKALPTGLSRFAGFIAASLFVAGLLGSTLTYGLTVGFGTIFAAFFRAGALVFGGGHVVLPLLEQATVTKGWITPQDFLSGYGAAQALPGPLFTFAAYLGAAVQPSPHPVLLGLEALLSIFVPGLCLMTAAITFWNTFRERRTVQLALRGVNASVVGILIAALYRPVWTSTVHDGFDFWLALLVFTALVAWKLPPWLIVFGAGTICGIIAM